MTAIEDPIKEPIIITSHPLGANKPLPFSYACFSTSKNLLDPLRQVLRDVINECSFLNDKVYLGIYF